MKEREKAVELIVKNFLIDNKKASGYISIGFEKGKEK